MSLRYTNIGNSLNFTDYVILKTRDALNKKEHWKTLRKKTNIAHKEMLHFNGIHN